MRRKRRLQIGAASNRAMIRQQQRIVVRHVRFKDGAQIGRARRGVAHQGEFSLTKRQPRAKAPGQVHTRRRETSRRRRIVRGKPPARSGRIR